jgi:hypothetical protein
MYRPSRAVGFVSRLRSHRVTSGVRLTRGRIGNLRSCPSGSMAWHSAPRHSTVRRDKPFEGGCQSVEQVPSRGRPASLGSAGIKERRRRWVFSMRPLARRARKPLAAKNRAPCLPGEAPDTARPEGRGTYRETPGPLGTAERDTGPARTRLTRQLWWGSRPAPGSCGSALVQDDMPGVPGGRGRDARLYAGEGQRTYNAGHSGYIRHWANGVASVEFRRGARKVLIADPTRAKT